MWTPAVTVKEPVPRQCLVEKGRPERARLAVRLSTVPDESWQEEFEAALEASSSGEHGVLECSLDGQYLNVSVVASRVEDALAHVEALCEEANETYRERFAEELAAQKELNEALQGHFHEVRDDLAYLKDAL